MVYAINVGGETMIVKKISMFFVIMMAATISAAPAVTDVTAKQRYPWNGLVDITCTVSGISGTANNLEFSMAAVNSGNVCEIEQFWVVKNGTNSADRAVHVNGTYHLVWDSNSDFNKQICSNMVVRVNVVRARVQLWENGPYWATTNIGADNPEDYGYYFWWGDTVGYKCENDKCVATDGSSSNYTFAEVITPTFKMATATLRNEGWISVFGALVPEHDAAHIHWGGEWRMPTDQELSDLINNCNWAWTTQNGVQGYVVKGKDTYASSSIFLPCAGCVSGNSLDDPGSCGSYWSSVPYPYSGDSFTDGWYAWSFLFNSRHPYTHRNTRGLGMSVRPVQDNYYTVTYCPGANASGELQKTTKTHGVVLTLKGAIFTRDGYTQTGWATSDGGAKVYNLDAPYTANLAVTLYPFWMVNSSVDQHDKVQLWENGPYWATTNIGADNPEDSGYYFWWGDTVGYRLENDTWVATDGSSSNFRFYDDPISWQTCIKSIAKLQSEGWITAYSVLTPVHDAAHVHWGGNWRMPTKQEFLDLVNNCDWTRTTQNGVVGYVVKGKGAYASASIFLPCAGYGNGTSLCDSDWGGYYWSSVPDSDGSNAWYLDFCFSVGIGYQNTYGRLRFYGVPVRPIQGVSQ